jgi:peptidoglycan/xylan/chitin deacetylase (PgdA/CDA1 family)
MHANFRSYERPGMTGVSAAQPLLTQVADHLLGPRGCMFTFHRAAGAAAWERLPNRDFYLNLDFLDRLLTYLVRNGWDIVTVDDAVGRVQTGKIPRKFVNFSVDDCYRDTYEEVVPLFRRHGVPVTLFVTTGIPDGTMPLLFAGLEDALGGHDRVQLEDGWRELSDDTARRALFAQLARDWDGPEGADRYARFCSLNDIDMDAMHWKHAITWDMLSELAADPHVEIGGHTISHPRISSLSAEAAESELAGCRKRLEEKLGIPVRHFAFPYGRAADCGPRDFQIATDSGFSSASHNDARGSSASRRRLSNLPRVTLNGVTRSMSMVEAHLTGLTSLIARVLGRV